MYFACISVALLGLVTTGAGFESGAGDGERLQRLQVEAAVIQQGLLQDTIEIQEWNIKVDRLKEEIQKLKKEKEYVQSQGKILTHLSRMDLPTLIIRTNTFPILGYWVVFFHFFFKIFIEHSVT